MFYHFLSTSTIIKNVRTTIRGQYDYYIADASFLNSDNTEVNITIETLIPLNSTDFTSIDHFKKGDIVEVEGSITSHIDNILKVRLLYFQTTKILVLYLIHSYILNTIA